MKCELRSASRVAYLMAKDFVSFHDPGANWCLKASLPADIVGNK